MHTKVDDPLKWYIVFAPELGTTPFCSLSSTASAFSGQFTKTSCFLAPLHKPS